MAATPTTNTPRADTGAGRPSLLRRLTTETKQAFKTSRHVHFALSVRPGKLDELSRRVAEMGIAHRGPVRHEGGDRSLYFEDPEGNVVETSDFFVHSDGAREGVEALTAGSEAA